MTTGNRETTRTNAAPRRRFRNDDDAGHLGDAPILLNLPSLCGVPDAAEQEPDNEDAANLLDQVAGPAASLEKGFDTHLDDTASSTSTLAQPEFTESSATEKPAPDEDDHDNEAEDGIAPAATGVAESDEFIESEEEDLIEQAPPKPSGIHRKIILGTLLFVIVTAIYMFANRGPSELPPLAAPAADVEMGWETADDMFSENIEDTGFVEPPYGSQFEAPMIPPISPAPAAGPESTAAPAPLPALNEAASSDWEMHRVGLNSADYPTTATPDAAYAAESPDNTRAPDATRR